MTVCFLRSPPLSPSTGIRFRLFAFLSSDSYAMTLFPFVHLSIVFGDPCPRRRLLRLHSTRMMILSLIPTLDDTMILSSFGCSV